MKLQTRISVGTLFASAITLASLAVSAGEIVQTNGRAASDVYGRSSGMSPASSEATVLRAGSAPVAEVLGRGSLSPASGGKISTHAGNVGETYGRAEGNTEVAKNVAPACTETAAAN
jgi:hypothetical protein